MTWRHRTLTISRDLVEIPRESADVQRMLADRTDKARITIDESTLLLFTERLVVSPQTWIPSLDRARIEADEDAMSSNYDMIASQGLAAHEAGPLIAEPTPRMRGRRKVPSTLHIRTVVVKTECASTTCTLVGRQRVAVTLIHGTRSISSSIRAVSIS
jgi:hypothetical protein